jgi:putative nucleotidyltransferase with HDIG domain
MLEMEPADIVVSDMRMPGMTGSQLLRDVMKRYPSVVRIALSGQADEESTFSAIGPTHQYLTKPCDGETLKQTIRRACALRSLLANEALLKIISRIESLPSLPQQYLEIERELRSPEPSIQNVGGIVARDIAMAAKVLQLVNSAFFGLTRHVSSPQMATSLLGLETIRALVLSVHVFSHYQDPGIPGFSLERLWSHSVQVASFAQSIARAERAGAEVINEAMIAGMLHDVGKLILAVNASDEYSRAVALEQDQHLLAWRAETQTFGVTHAEVGAYLLGLWGLPQGIVDAVAHHHHPSGSAGLSFDAVMAVHAADAIQSEACPGHSPGEGQLDEEHLARVGLLQRVPVWRTACQAAKRAGSDQ